MKKNLLVWVTVLLTFWGNAQDGPAGVGSSTNNLIWFDIERMGAANGASISSITDFSGNSNHFLQSTVSAQGTYATNGLNGNAILGLDGINDWYRRFTLPALDGVNTISYFVVANCLNTTNYGNFFSVRSSTTNAAIRLLKYNSTFYSNVPKTAGGGTPVQNTYQSGWQMHTNIWDGAASALKYYVGSTSQGSASNAGGTIPVCTMIGMGRNLYNSGGHFPGDYSEVILYNTVLNETQRAIIENYLAAKYNLTTSNDLYSEQAAHPHEVAGIGQETPTDNHTTAKGTGVVTVAGASDLDNGEYLIWGHDNGAFASQSTELPVALAGGSRLTREWASDETGGDLGTVDITFDMSALSLGADPTEFRIITDSDGNFSNGNANPTITPVVVGSDITFNNVDLSTESFFTIAYSGNVVECISISSADWDDASPAIVWDCMVEPDSTTSVTIDNTTSITVDADASCYDLVIDGGGTLVLSPGVDLVIKGDLTINSGTPDGSISCGAGSRIIFRGAEGAAQVFDNNTSAAIQMSDLEIANPDGVTLAAGGSFEVANGLFLTGGSLTNSGTFTFTSDASSTGHIAQVVGTNSITGSINVERFRSARAADWSSIGNSGVTTDLEDLDDDIFMSGIPGSDGAATSSSGGSFISIAYFDNTTDAYVVPNGTSDTFELGRGYEVWLGDNLTTWAAQAWTLDGTANLAAASLSVNSGGGGWNLFANPYPAFLDFSIIESNYVSLVGDEWWYYDADLASYNSNGTAVDIPPGQGFWIDWTGGPTTIDLDITTSIIDLSSSTFYKTDEKEELRIGIRQDNSIFGSAVFLRKDDMAFAGVDENDLTPLRLPDPRASHLVMEYAGEDMMLNYVSDFEDHIEIPMRFEPGQAGDFTMSFKGLESFDDYQCINIIDNEDGKQIEITPATTLRVTIGENLSERTFKLLLSKADYADCLAPADLSDEDIRITSIGKTIMTDFFLDRSANADITIYNVLGAPVFSNSMSVGYSRESFDLNHLQSGLYVVNVSINGSTTTEKVILQ
ncbi:MAG: T9SS type A sorting domain-containing protein [Flavobacteriales bacterium]|nr:T9SS type A sorting domain-containing protein [Flavobacteriales bacterium]